MPEGRSCPRCRVDLVQVERGAFLLRECQGCHGVWVERDALQRICDEREKPVALLGPPLKAPPSAVHRGAAVPAYLPCPECRDLMNRVQFARGCGILLDVCSAHGTWFDEAELRAMVDFIHAGGLQRASERDKVDLEVARTRRRQERLFGRGLPDYATRDDSPTDTLLDAVASVGDVWTLLD